MPAIRVKLYSLPADGVFSGLNDYRIPKTFSRVLEGD
jgi:hypothetical protein